MASKKRMNIKNSAYVDVVTVVSDRINRIAPFLCVVGYDTTIKVISKEASKKNQIYISDIGYFDVRYKMYDITKQKDPNSDYSLLILSKKDEVVKANNGNEFLQSYIYTKNSLPSMFDMKQNQDLIPQELIDIVYDKLYSMTPVPILKEWTKYIVRQLMNIGAINTMQIYHGFEDNDMTALYMRVGFASLFQIISNGLSSNAISIGNSNTPSQEILDVTGLDSYLESYTEILTRKIQDSFVPKFIPGVDDFSNRLNTFSDYASYKGIDLYDAQKCIIQSVSNNLDIEGTSLIVGEMGSGIVYINQL